MHIHQIFEHPYFEERPVKDILEPFGFEVHTVTHELPSDLDGGDDYARYEAEPDTYIDQLDNTAPAGYTEIYRAENEDGILIVSVRAKTVFAQLLLFTDIRYSGPEDTVNASYLAVYNERMRQIFSEGFSRENDDQHKPGSLAVAGASYAINAADALQAESPESGKDAAAAVWPFDQTWWKPSPDPRRNLIKAGALILAEIECLDRAAAKAAAAGGDA